MPREKKGRVTVPNPDVYHGFQPRGCLPVPSPPLRKAEARCPSLEQVQTLLIKTANTGYTHSQAYPNLAVYLTALWS